MKKLSIVLAAIVFGVTFAIGTVYASTYWPSYGVDNGLSSDTVEILVDPETDIEYIVINRHSTDGGCSITPRLTSAGNPRYVGDKVVE